MRPSRCVGGGGGGGSGGVFTNYVPSLNFRTTRFMYWGGSHVPVDILLLYNIMRLPLSLSQFRSIFLLLICHRFTCVIWLPKPWRLSEFYPNRASLMARSFFFTFYFVCFRQRRHFCNAKSAPQIMVLPASGTAAMTLKHAVRISTFALPMSSWP